MKKKCILHIGYLFVLILVVSSCRTSMETAYSGEFWGKHDTSWRVKKWHLEDWNELRPGLGGWEDNDGLIDSLRSKLAVSSEPTVASSMETIGKMLDENIEEDDAPVVAIVSTTPSKESLYLVQATADALSDESSLFVSVEPQEDEFEPHTVYNVIVGCYKSSDRANVHLSDLKGDGYSDSKIIVSKYGLNRVSIKEFLEKELALKFAEDYRPIRSDVWIYSRTVEKN